LRKNAPNSVIPSGARNLSFCLAKVQEGFLAPLGMTDSQGVSPKCEGGLA
jgi:hypothetical protein